MSPEIEGWKMKRFAIALAITAALTGCAQGRWVKYGASQQEANQDHYACLQESQQRVSGAQVNAYGGSAQNVVITNQQLYYACIQARGYIYVRPQWAVKWRSY